MMHLAYVVQHRSKAEGLALQVKLKAEQVIESRGKYGRKGAVRVPPSLVDGF